MRKHLHTSSWDAHLQFKLGELLHLLWVKSCSWHGPSIEEAWRAWLQDHRNKNIKALPLLIHWGIWLAQNASIFKEKVSLPDIIAAKSLAILAHFPQEKGAPPPRQVVEEQINFTRPWDFFLWCFPRQWRPLWGRGSPLYLPISFL
jgi:hypothetical protein